MEVLLRAALLKWLAGDPTLSAQLNAMTEEAPARTSLPWVAISASSGTDWSTKDLPGREIRIALELQCRGDQPGSAADLAAAIEARIDTMPAAQSGFVIASCVFLRSRAEQRAPSRRAVLVEYRFRVLAA